MGWTWQQAKHYRRGKIDRKAECDAYFSGINADCYIVEKSAMIGTVYYAAVRIIGNHNFKDNTSVPIPEESQIVFAAVFQTSTNDRDYYNFGYKDMDETMLPCFYDCPVRILKLLTPTDNANANEWRHRCMEAAAKKKAERSDPNSLDNLPVGTVIKCNGHIAIKTAPMSRFKTPFWKAWNRNAYFSKADIKRNGFEIVSRSETAQ